MRVLHVIPSLDEYTGGPARALVGLACAQAAQGTVVRVVTAEMGGAEAPLPESLRKGGVELLFSGASGSLRPEVPLEGVDVLHLHGVWEHVIFQFARAARKAGIPYIMRPCGMLDPWSLSQKRLKKSVYLRLRLRGILRRATLLHATSGDEAMNLERLGLGTPSVVVPNGLDWREIEALRNPSCDGATQGPPTIAFLGRLHPKKGLDLLLTALAQCGDPKVQLLVAGHGEPRYVRTLQEQTEALGLSERVRFLGHLPGAARLEFLAGATILALPSHQENFGIAIVESLACGTPVLVSDAIAIGPDLEKGGVGRRVPLRAECWAGAIDRAISGPPICSAAQARAFAREHYDWAVIAGRWAEIYNGLAGPNPEVRHA